MDRSLSSHSMDTVVDTFLSKAAKFPRTDSEDQFRKFLERIPSTTNLANQQGSMQSLPQAQQEQLQQQLAHFQQHSLQLASSGTPLSAQLPEGGSLNVGGIPRVPSLDLLHQLITQQQQHQQQTPGANSSGAKPLQAGSVPVKEEAESSLALAEPISRPVPPQRGSDALRSSAEPTLPLGMPASSGLSLPASVGELPVSGHAHLTAPAVQLPVMQTQPTKRSGTKDSKAEVRKARRMLSNRESARRSRRRKQEHLSSLEEQIMGLEEERDLLAEKLEKLERQVASHAEQNQALKRENEDLRQQLGLEEKRGSSKRQCNGHQ